MITQQDIDALKRIKQHCKDMPDCENCVLDVLSAPCEVGRAEFWNVDDIKPDITDEQLCQRVETPAIDPLTQRLDSLEATVNQLAESLVETNRKLAIADNNIETIANSFFVPVKLADGLNIEQSTKSFKAAIK